MASLRRYTRDVDDYKIVIAGPATPGFLIEMKQAGEMILNMNGKLYPVSEMERWAPRYAGLDVHYGHGSEEKIGEIHSSWWEPVTREIHGILLVSDPVWRERLAVRRFEGTLNTYGISQISSVKKFGWFKMGHSRFPQVVIEDVIAVDIVDDPQFGGRFLEAEENHDWSIRALEYLIEVKYGNE